MSHDPYHFSRESEEDKIKMVHRERDQHRAAVAQRKARQKRQAITIGVIAFLIIGALALFIAFAGTGLTSAEEENTVVTEEMLPEVTGYRSFTLLATGDNLLHTKLYNEANSRAGGTGYDFTALYEGVADLTKTADICFINQETPLATAIAEPSSYPMFNTPTETVEDLHKIGFNVFNNVSNHTLDKGCKGVEATVDALSSIPDSMYVGAYKNTAEMEQVHAMEVNGIKVAFVGFTEMTNGITKDPASEVAFVYTSDEAEMEKLVKMARDGADVVVVSVHWGEENVFSANDGQRALAQKFADWGADIILGHHPHVLEEIENVTSADGRVVPVCYSLGNFTSTMNLQANHVGGFFKCSVIVDNATGEVRLADEEFIPVINHFRAGKNGIRVVLYSNYDATMENENGFQITRSYVDNLLRDTVGTDLVKGLEPIAPAAEQEGDGNEQ